MKIVLTIRTPSKNIKGLSSLQAPHENKYSRANPGDKRQQDISI